MSSLEMLIKVRDGIRQILDGLDEFIEKSAPPGREGSQSSGDQDPQGKPLTWDPGLIPWEQKQGPKGAYLVTQAKGNETYKIMLRDLQDHKGKLRREGFFYWVFEDGFTVGRKKVEG